MLKNAETQQKRRKNVKLVFNNESHVWFVSFLKIKSLAIWKFVKGKVFENTLFYIIPLRRGVALSISIDCKLLFNQQLKNTQCRLEYQF